MQVCLESSPFFPACWGRKNKAGTLILLLGCHHCDASAGREELAPVQAHIPPDEGDAEILNLGHPLEVAEKAVHDEDVES